MNLIVVYTKDLCTMKDYDDIKNSITRTVSLKYDIILLPSEMVDRVEVYDDEMQKMSQNNETKKD